jgi:hypothetical protein|tara:strand:- start:312 stop:461 length:150 start_codon:yes stop_codon:yes gene_type:complete
MWCSIFVDIHGCMWEYLTQVSGSPSMVQMNMGQQYMAKIFTANPMNSEF